MAGRKVRSIKAKLLIPLGIVIAVQMLSLVLFYQYGGIMPMLRGNAVKMFSETTKHSKLNMEQELIQNWVHSVRDTDGISEQIEQILKEHGCSAKDIAENPELNGRIIFELTERLINMLHYSSGNGVYLILDGPASVNGDASEQAGIYIRDMEARSYEEDYSDLLLEWGLPTIAKEYGIALDSFWEMGFNPDTVKTTDFYKKPLEAAVKGAVKTEDADECAYLGTMQEADDTKPRSLTYSVPLILSDGSVIGVLGCELDVDRIREFLEDDFDKTARDFVSFLAKGTSGQKSFVPVIAGNTYYAPYYDNIMEISYEDSEWNHVGVLKDQNGNTCYAAIEPLEIYNSNTPFSNENWMVVRMKQEKSLFAESNEIRRILVVSIAGSLVLSLVMMVLTSYVTARPIRRLMKDMQNIDVENSLHLEKVYIQEIDGLIDEVNRLNSDVAEHASKISQILDALNMEIGVFEYEEGAEKIFCSHSLLKLFGKSGDESTYQFVDTKAFQEKAALMKNPVEDGDGKIYEYQDGKKLRYIRVKIMKTAKKRTTGVLIDVTAEMKERKRLEQERDCDLLTGLYNRGGFQNKVAELLSEGTVSQAAFVMWDMDNLKYVNDTYGHEAGDLYINMFADYLRALEKEGAVVARRSGDEFMAMLYHGDEAVLRDRIRESMEQLKNTQMSLKDGSHITLSASAGVAWYPAHGTDPDDLIRCADFAMYLSKHSQKGTVQEFVPD